MFIAFSTSDSFGSNQVDLNYGDLKDFNDDLEILSAFNVKMKLSQIKIRDGSHTDQIQFVLSVGNQTIELSRHGGQGGDQNQYNVPDGHRVTKIEVWSGIAVNALRFTTDKGDVSIIFGNTYSPTSKVVFAPPNGHLTGLKGKSSKIINMLSFIYFFFYY